MWILAAVAVGCILDLIFGDPHRIPHPVRFIGLLISAGEGLLRKGCKGRRSEFFCGAVLSVFVIVLSALIPFLILLLFLAVNRYLAFAVHCIMCCQIIAAKSLKTESMKVYRKLLEGDLPGAREMTSQIVGRDTASLDEPQVVRGVVETISENTSDGVIAPLIFMLIGGAPLGFLYKAVNTLDSMIGYKNEKYISFGRFAARLDDAVNYIPARVSAMLMITASALCGYNFKNAIKIYKRDRRNHSSPNAAQTESVCAGALGIELAGPNYYAGKLVEKPVIGDSLRSVEKEDILKANKLMYCTFALALIAGAAVWLAAGSL
jgi:adenosylcobinamide-phosphate synthase